MGIRLGLRENWRQFALLIVVNGFVGGMVGLERTILPLLAEGEFGLASRSAILSFIATFGLAKALSNLFAGGLSDRVGRKRVLLLGWLLGLPVPLIIMIAPSWEWIVFGNMLLGMNQGITWSTTVIMKIDLVGPRSRGLAMGLNEASGYVGVAIAALASGYIAARYGMRPAPFYLGFAFALAGLLLTAAFVRETRHHSELEARMGDEVERRRFKEVFLLTSWKNRTLFSVSQAGMINNLNDGVAWGLFPVYFATLGIPLRQIAFLAAIYPAVWGLAQLFTGAFSDHAGRKPLIVGGMLVQAAALAVMAQGGGFWMLASSMAALGVGTAMVYPVLLAAIGDVAHPTWRASSVGVYRLWRDSGYIVGALLAGITADLLGMGAAIGLVAVLTAASGALASVTMPETRERAAVTTARRS